MGATTPCSTLCYFLVENVAEIKVWKKISLEGGVLSCAVHSAEEVLDAEASRGSGKQTRADRFISPREYYAYILQIRLGNMLLRAGRLF